MFSKEKLLLFDVDYTLVKASRLHKEAIVEAIKRVFKVDPPIEKLKLHGMTDGQIIIDLLKLCGFSVKEILPDLKRCMGEASDYYNKNIFKEDTTVLAGVRELLDEISMRKDIIPGLLTGNIEGIAYGKLASVGISHYFKVGGFGSDHIERSKLVDFALKRAKQRFGFNKKENVYLIGDTPKDVMAAKDAGVKCIAVATGSFSVDELKKSGADFVIKDFTEKNSFFNYIDDDSK